MRNKIAQLKNILFFSLIVFFVVFFIYSIFHIEGVKEKNINNQKK